MKVAKYEKLRLVDKENKRQKTRQNQTKNPKETHSEQTKTKERKREKKRKVTLPTQSIFPNDFSRVIYLVSLSKSAEHKPFTLLNLCCLLGATFCKNNHFF